MQRMQRMQASLRAQHRLSVVFHALTSCLCFYLRFSVLVASCCVVWVTSLLQMLGSFVVARRWRVRREWLTQSSARRAASPCSPTRCLCPPKGAHGKPTSPSESKESCTERTMETAPGKRTRGTPKQISTSDSKNTLDPGKTGPSRRRTRKTRQATTSDEATLAYRQSSSNDVKSNPISVLFLACNAAKRSSFANSLAIVASCGL